MHDFVNDDFRLKEIHVAPRGAKFRIVVDGRLYSLRMENGGIHPDITKGKFTSYSVAKEKLYQYFKENPKPEEKGKRILTPIEN